MRRLAVSIALVVPLIAQAAGAQSASDKATAEALFADGRRLLAQGKYRDACPKFEASLKLDPGVGAMLNLADCYEKNGQSASAWAEFLEASAAARAAGSKDREDLARQRATALEPKLSHLVVIVGKAPVQVTRDGSALDPAAFGTPMPVDPGKHLIEATASGKQKWSKTVDVPASAASISLEIPDLADAGSADSSVVASGAATDKASSASSQRTVAIAAGAVGVVALGAGAIFGLGASSKWSDAKATCTHFPDGCSADGVDAGKDASSKANIATVAFILGGASIAAGAVLWFTAPKPSESNVALGLAPTGVVVRGGF